VREPLVGSRVIDVDDVVRAHVAGERQPIGGAPMTIT
jgi:hypothetical protein